MVVDRGEHRHLSLTTTTTTISHHHRHRLSHQRPQHCLSSFTDSDHSTIAHSFTAGTRANNLHMCLTDTTLRTRFAPPLRSWLRLSCTQTSPPRVSSHAAHARKLSNLVINGTLYSHARHHLHISEAICSLFHTSKGESMLCAIFVYVSSHMYVHSDCSSHFTSEQHR